MEYTSELQGRIKELIDADWRDVKSAANAVGITEKPDGSSWNDMADEIAIAEFTRDGKTVYDAVEPEAEADAVEPEADADAVKPEVDAVEPDAEAGEPDADAIASDDEPESDTTGLTESAGEPDAEAIASDGKSEVDEADPTESIDSVEEVPAVVAESLPQPSVTVPEVRGSYPTEWYRKSGIPFCNTCGERYLTDLHGNPMCPENFEPQFCPRLGDPD